MISAIFKQKKNFWDVVFGIGYCTSMSTKANIWFRCFYSKIAENEHDCINSISTISNKKIFLVLDNSPSDTLLASLNSLSQVDSVFVYSSTSNKADESNEVRQNRIITRCQNATALKDAIQAAYEDFAKHAATFSTYNQKEKATRDLTKESGSFLFFQLFKSALMNMPKMVDSKAMMVSRCRDYYRGNTTELANIDEFELTYKSTEAIEWYTKETFLYKWVSKSAALIFWSLRYESKPY